MHIYIEKSVATVKKYRTSANKLIQCNKHKGAEELNKGVFEYHFLARLVDIPLDVEVGRVVVCRTLGVRRIVIVAADLTRSSRSVT